MGHSSNKNGKKIESMCHMWMRHCSRKLAMGLILLRISLRSTTMQRKDFFMELARTSLLVQIMLTEFCNQEFTIFFFIRSSIFCYALFRVTMYVHSNSLFRSTSIGSFLMA